jgi:hypothetical protein
MDYPLKESGPAPTVEPTLEYLTEDEVLARQADKYMRLRRKDSVKVIESLAKL